MRTVHVSSATAPIASSSASATDASMLIITSIKFNIIVLFVTLKRDSGAEGAANGSQAPIPINLCRDVYGILGLDIGDNTCIRD
ncbi:12524_t:CDS:2 [Ambispora leptoticha]|uniref:12524_t:CDS:1 n=1 Tax=Ambispora leptoticha TaxID=144679 RepID=A0A9N9BQE0_9GLOM|nr:12524_t:CDS:2 [Ambispora leptoticha]